MFFRKKNKKKYKDIYPDEIFADSHNFPEFDTSQLEGRLEKPLGKKTVLFLGLFFALVSFVFIGRVWSLQIQKGELYAARGEQNTLKHSIIFSKRGVIYDRNKIPLAWNEQNENGDFALRKYTDLSGLSNLLGYIGYPLKDSAGFFYQEEIAGKEGVEKFFNENLAGRNGLKIYESDVLSNIISESVIKQPQDGEDIFLSVDSKIQNKLYREIAELASKVGFKGGASVIMDIKTGEIIAMVSYPEFKSQILTDLKDKKIIGNFLQDPNKPFLNRVAQGLYTPGSIVKPFIGIGALNSGVVTPDTKILSTGEIKIPNPYEPNSFSVFKDWKAHGLVNIKEAIAMSSNVYFYEVGGGYKNQRGIGIEGIESYARAFGLGTATGIDWLDEADGVVPNPKWKEENFEGDIWRLGDTYNTAIGQYGFQITPIQMARAIAGIANYGILATPSIILGEMGAFNKIPIEIKNEYFDIIKEGMRDSVLFGTSKGLNVSNFEVAAKTGTAEIGISKKYVNSWSIGFFPYKNPRFSFVTVMESGPGSNLMGSVFVMRNLFDWMIVNAPEYVFKDGIK